ncbi:uncharacterized protein EV420DRAFT_1278301, partial [Desarmillaria tabescens]
YFVEKSPYMEHLHKFVSEEEISTYSGFAVTFLANIKNIHGLHTMRIVGCTCLRQSIWRKCVSLALFLCYYLQPSQRQCNVNGIVVQALNNVEVKVIISYDIICQWGIHFWDHMAEFPDDTCLKITLEAIDMCVPKFHLWAHKPHCYAHFSFNYVSDAGQTHREMSKENWADSNKAMA